MRQTLPILTRLPPLIGRRGALSEAKTLLLRTALLTLAGPGGCGKTRLALEIASDVGAAYPDGVWMVELAPLVDPTALPEVMAAALDLHLPPSLTVVEGLVAYLQPREALLVCDNCEHLLPACVEFFEMLLAACPRLRVLATSREILNSALEVAWPVPPLSLPDTAAGEDAETVGASEAVQLFVQRAAAALHDFTLTDGNAAAVGQICRCLDGLPLAIELAARSVKVLAPEQIAAQLAQGFHLLSQGYRTAAPRQQSLEATMEWSYRLLTPDEQALFRRISVLGGTFDLGAALAVGDGLPETVLGHLRQLIDKSLITVVQCEREVRYHALDTLRQFGRKHLCMAGEERETFARYCQWVARLVDATALEGHDHAIWLECCEREVDHLRLTLSWMLKHRQLEGALHLATSLLVFWRQRGHISEGRRWLETALAADPGCSAIAPLTRARALNGLGVLLMWQCDYVRAQAHHEEALSLFGALDDQPGIARTLFRLGFLADRRGDYPTAKEYLERSLRICTTLDDHMGVDMALNRLGITAWNQGDYDRATSSLEQSLQFQRRQGHIGGCASTLLNLGMLALECGDGDRATALLRESLALNRAVGDRLALTYGHTFLGYAALYRNELSSAAQSFGDALALLDMETTPEIVFRFLDGIATLAARRGSGASAARIWGAMDVVGSKHGLAYRPIERQRYRREVAARRDLDPQSFAQAWQEGRTMTLANVLRESCTVLALPADECTRAALGDSLGHSWDDPPGGSAAGGHTKPDTTPVVAPRYSATSSLRAYGSARSSATVPYDAEEPQPRLRIHAFGQVQVYHGERLITATDLTYTKARELLYFLLQHPPSTKEQIGLALWPDATPDYLRTTFRVVIHHLRRALGREVWIARQQQYYAFNRSLPYWYDVEAFEATVREATMLQAGSSARAVACLEVAQKVYRGDFWEGMTASDWIAQERDRLRRTYLDVLLSLGELYRRSGAVRQALEIFLRASEWDRYCEEAHRGVLRCYLEVHEPGQAAHHFERLRRDLEDHLGLAPAAETVALLRAHVSALP
jgi:non-specific serine/threonine protein kinase